MEEETEFTKLPVEDRCVHKSWKARVHGYEECTKKFGCIDDEKSPEWNKFLGLMKKFVVDSNVAAQEKGLEAALAFVENAACAGKTVGEVMSGIVNKCIAAPKAKTKDLAVQITLMYIEIEKHETVQEELLKGTEAKNPKIVAGCINTLTLSLREFGSKVINIKPLVKKMPGFLEDRDKIVREEGKAMVIEIYRWIGIPIKQQLNTLKPVQMSELEVEFGKLDGAKAYPTRYLRSQKPKNVIAESAAAEGDDVDDDEAGEEEAAEDIDPYELIDPVDILSKLPKDFYDKLEAKKWQERKEALEALETLCKNPKLESGDYGDVIRALKKIIAKDSNVVVVTIAGKCLTGLANGLKKRFHPYATACLPVVLEKFREKKPNVVAVLREAADAVFQSITVDVILEDALAALENKNPSVKAETAAFLGRCFAHTLPATLNKKLLKAYIGALLKTLNEPDPTVRDNSAEALGTAMKLVGEKAMMPFLTDLDALKMAKIQECAEKAVILVKVVAPKKPERPTTAPAKVESKPPAKGNAKKPAASVSNSNTYKKPNLKKPAAGGKKTVAPKTQIEKDLSAESVDDIAGECLTGDILSGLVDANWKSRLAAVEQLNETIKQMGSDVPCQVIVRILAKKPGFKDTNFQVLKQRLEVIKMLAENYTFSITAANYCIMDIAEKLGDAKNGSTAAETLLAIAEATSFEHVANEVVTFAFNQKSPKVQQESLVWLSNALLEFSCALNVKLVIESVKKAVAATNPGVRTAAITLIGTLYLYVGKPLLTFFDGEKPALKQQIEQECEKHDGERPPEPTRGPKSRDKKVADDAEEEEEENYVAETVDINDLIPRVDISNQITEALLAELGDKNWKVRNEGLIKVQAMITDAKFIKGSIGELPRALSPRLVDSNTKIAQTALGICEALSSAMGPPIKQHVRVLFPGFVHCLGDSKNWIRSAAISCINSWGDQCGYKEFFDGEMIGDALKAGSPTLRIELWNWLAQKLPPIPVKQVPKEELMLCVPHLYSNLEDRNSDVRKNAQEAILGFMMHLTYEGMLRQTEKLKPGSKNVVVAALEKTRPSLPIKPLPTKKQEQVKTVKSGGAAKVAKAVIKPKSATAAKPASARKKDDDVDTSPLLAVNNLKHQRVIDEQKLKVLKWNFTTPREEFVELLKELMSTAGVNKSLIANMFHTDFRYHLKAIESLSDNVQDNSKALTCNLDLILKWLTLRFFDTNPSVLLKGLDFLQAVFQILIEDQYHMLENEAASFLPYLILKIGDPKDSVRNSVRALFKRIALVYPVSKLFSYVMEGLKSKNARQRTECLDQLGSLIENYGVTVCQPTPAAALREIAKQIADRDNSVRNAALNCIVQAYYLEGERIHKLIGNISEKDMSLLEERIKRANKNRPSKPASAVRMSTMPMIAAAASNEDIEPDDEGSDEKDEETEEIAEDFDDRTHVLSTTTKINKINLNVPPSVNRVVVKSPDNLSNDQENNFNNTYVNNKPEKTYAISPPQSPVRAKPSGPFGLDMEFLRQLEEKYPANWTVPVLPEIKWDPNDSITSIQNIDRLLVEISPSKLPASKPSLRVSPVTSPVSSKNDNLDCIILLMASPRLQTALQALNNMDEMIKSSPLTLIQSKEDKFINSINMQLKFLQKYPLTPENSEVTKVYRATFVVLLSFLESKVLGKNVSMPQLKELIYLMLMLLAENKFEHVEDTDMYMRVVNVIIVKTIDYSNHTTLICVLIKLLQECAESTVMPKYEELVMKCLWKIVKTISNRSAELDYDTILLTVHQFFKDYPSSWWKTRHSDLPVRTVKTVLHSMTKIKGRSMLNHLTLINNIQESELRSYLNRLIDMVNSSNNGQTKQRHMSKEMHAQLTEIFKKIGSKQQSHEGLVQLYDFKQEHPEADIQPFLAKSHQFFRNYIEQNLKIIDQERKNQMSAEDPVQETARAISAAEERISMDPAQRLERLRALEAQYRGNGSRPT
ncbi:protein mini spindles isoform X1 [Cotesia glomerata]|uniref:protein mini spindles isoform X1 n=1 Tax=Cotesia glomerata TaxID=32391 RepID=UPI001D0342B1|nr:protein mini spindles isoform X1 [Cotesia glomerata]